MKISLSAIDYDIFGTLLLEVDNASFERQRRASRTATLDGGASFYDTGYSVADATLYVTVTKNGLSDSVLKALCAFFENYPFILISTLDGVFIAKPDKISSSNGCNFSFMLKEKVSL